MNKQIKLKMDGERYPDPDGGTYGFIPLPSIIISKLSFRPKSRELVSTAACVLFTMIASSK